MFFFSMSSGSGIATRCTGPRTSRRRSPRRSRLRMRDAARRRRGIRLPGERLERPRLGPFARRRLPGSRRHRPDRGFSSVMRFIQDRTSVAMTDSTGQSMKSASAMCVFHGSLALTAFSTSRPARRLVAGVPPPRLACNRLADVATARTFLRGPARRPSATDHVPETGKRPWSLAHVDQRVNVRLRPLAADPSTFWRVVALVLRECIQRPPGEAVTFLIPDTQPSSSRQVIHTSRSTRL